jgi:DNA-binding FadR family transcriptional regulator
MVKPKKRGDLVVDEIKRWISGRELGPGDRLPKEADLQALFGVSKGTIREALKSLEVHGLITLTTGPTGGARIGEVPLDRTFQFVQDYLFFKDVTIEDIYAMRRLIEPELAAGAVPYLTEEHLAALERSIEFCAPVAQGSGEALQQRQEDLHFHDILAEANPNVLLRFVCRIINELLRRQVEIGQETSKDHHARFGHSNLVAHQAIVAAARRSDAEEVRALMHAHIGEAERYVRQLHAVMRNDLAVDSEVRVRVYPPRG